MKYAKGVLWKNMCQTCVVDAVYGNGGGGDDICSYDEIRWWWFNFCNHLVVSGRRLKRQTK